MAEVTLLGVQRTQRLFGLLQHMPLAPPLSCVRFFLGQPARWSALKFVLCLHCLPLDQHFSTNLAVSTPRGPGWQLYYGRRAYRIMNRIQVLFSSTSSRRVLLHPQFGKRDLSESTKSYNHGRTTSSGKEIRTYLSAASRTPWLPHTPVALPYKICPPRSPLPTMDDLGLEVGDKCSERPRSSIYCSLYRCLPECTGADPRIKTPATSRATALACAVRGVQTPVQPRTHKTGYAFVGKFVSKVSFECVCYIQAKDMNWSAYACTEAHRGIGLLYEKCVQLRTHDANGAEAFTIERIWAAIRTFEMKLNISAAFLDEISQRLIAACDNS